MEESGQAVEIARKTKIIIVSAQFGIHLLKNLLCPKMAVVPIAESTASICRVRRSWSDGEHGTQSQLGDNVFSHEQTIMPQAERPVPLRCGFHSA